MNTNYISQQDLKALIDGGNAPLILDVRTEQEFNQGHVPGARLIPHTLIGGAIDGLSEHKDQTIVLYCKSGMRTGMAIGVLQDAGFSKVLHLDGDMDGWRAAGLPIE